MKTNKTIYIQAVSSDIGHHLANHWIEQGNSVSGTYRTMSSNVEALIEIGVKVTECNLNDPQSIDAFADWTLGQPPWDVFVLAAGVQEPIGLFSTIDIDLWEASIYQNFVSQFRLLRKVLESRNLSTPHPPVVLMFAGGGTNSATVRYSAYTISKIACIKMCELLDAEVRDTTFTILGPGWVDTKIHEATLRAGEENAGENLSKTRSMLEDGKCNPMSRVIECCDWIVNAPKEVVGGRNFSLAHDPWDSNAISCIENDPDLFRLRRFGNNFFGEDA